MDKPTIRTAQPPDIDAIVKLVESAYRGESSRQGWTTEADLLDGSRTFTEEVFNIISEAGNKIILVEEFNQLLACVHIKKLTNGRAYLGMFAVAPNMQNKGIGKELLSHAEKRAREQWCCNEIEITVIEQRTELIEWYERRGYVKTGDTRNFPHEEERYGVPKVQKLILFVFRKAI